jgi:hypothetical protein
MTKLTKFIKVFLLAIFLLLNNPLPTFGQDEFTLSQELTYQIDEQDNCQVSHNIGMTNNFSSIYATQYSLAITGTPVIKDIAASSENGPLRTEIDRANRNLTKITVFFDSPVTGKDKTNQFTIRYQIENFVENVGQTKRITIPKIDNIAQLDQASLIISVPANFGSPSFVSPKNFQQTNNNGRTTISFTKANLIEKEVMAIFGDIQTMQFNLKYFLENKNSQTTENIIALPPDTSYQKIFLANIEPLPEKIIVDEDGNWLAYYSLKPGEELTVEAQGLAQITAEPQSPPLIPTDFSIYLEQDNYWEVNDPIIKNLTKQLTTIEQIYRYVTDNLEYDLGRVKNKETLRLGALGALEAKNKAICTEFTDLFVALARTAGIPAREINGYAYSANPQVLPATLDADVLHSWPEYWDDNAQTWHQVDPTWEATSNIDYFNRMDMAHLAFVIHGKDSQFPSPAGAYQKEGQHQKSVNVAFGQLAIDLSTAELSLDWDLNKEIPARQSLPGSITITNPNNHALYQTNIKLIGEGIGVTPKEKIIEVLPPFGQVKLPITVSNQSFWKSSANQLIVQIFTKNLAMEKTFPLQGLSILNWQNLVSYRQIILPAAGLLLLIVLFVLKKTFASKKN